MADDEIPTFATREEEHAWHFNRMRDRIQAAFDDYMATPYSYDPDGLTVTFAGGWIFMGEVQHQGGRKTVLTMTPDHTPLHSIMGMLARETARRDETVRMEFRGDFGD